MLDWARRVQPHKHEAKARFLEHRKSRRTGLLFLAYGLFAFWCFNSMTATAGTLAMIKLYIVYLSTVGMFVEAKKGISDCIATTDTS